MKKTGLIIAGIVAVFVGIIFVSRINTSDTNVDYARFSLAAIQDLAKKNDYSNYNLDSVISPDENTGNLPENIDGDVSTAKLVIFEYADYECSHCAEFATMLERFKSQYADGEVAIVFRSFHLSYNANSVAATAAADAAAIQGYWKEYKTILFANQAEWAYLKGANLTSRLKEYFKEATNGEGDLEKFKSDMESEAVAKKMAFDHGAGLAIKLEGTPTVRIDGEDIELENYATIFAQKAEEKGLTKKN